MKSTEKVIREGLRRSHLLSTDIEEDVAWIMNRVYPDWRKDV